MLYILLLLGLCFLFYFIISLFPLKFPPFKLDTSALWCFYGAPGCGKSTLAAFFAAKAMASGITVFSNMPILGTHRYDKSDLGRYNIENCLILWDEAGVDANSRNFKANFNLDQIRFLKYHRHEECMMIIFSQGFDDMDKILRVLTTDNFVVRRGLFHTIKYRRISKTPDIDEITHKPDDIYAFVPFSTRRIYAPSVWPYFDSWSRLGLPEKEFPLWGEKPK